MISDRVEGVELLKRQAAGIAAQLPADQRDALRVLEYAEEIIQCLGAYRRREASGADHAERFAAVARQLVIANSPE